MEPETSVVNSNPETTQEQVNEPPIPTKTESFIAYIKTFIIVKYILLLIKYPGFRYLWFGFLISFFGDFFSFIACVDLINKYTPETAGIGVGFYLLIKNLPATIISPLAGVLADRFDRRKIMLMFDVFRAIGTLNYMWVRSAERIWILFLVGGLQSLCSGFFEPCQSAVLPNTIEDVNDLLVANALSGSTWSIATGLASGIGGLVVSVLGTDANFIMDSLTYVISAICVLQLFRLGIKGSKVKKEEISESNVKEEVNGDFNMEELTENLKREPESKQETLESDQQEFKESENVIMEESTEQENGNAEETPKEQEIESLVQHEESKWRKFKRNFINLLMNPFRMVFDLIQFFYNDIDLFWLSFVRGFVASIFGGLAVGHIQYLETDGVIFGQPSLTVGLYYTAIGISCFFGPMFAQKYCDGTPKGMRIWIVIGYFIGGIGSMFSAFSFHFVWMVVFGALLRPFGESIVFTIGVTTLQRSVPDHLRGRVFSFSSGFFTLTISMAGLLAGGLKDFAKFSIFQVMLVFGIWSIVVFLIYFIYIVIYLILDYKGKVSKTWSVLN
jgi:MFS family permease